MAWIWPVYRSEFRSKCPGHTSVSLLSCSFIVQFLSLLSGWLSSRSVSFISETFLWLESRPCLAQNFRTGDALEELRKLKALQPNSQELQAAKYGKVPRSVGIANNWEEISNGVWCCPIKVKAAVRNACTRTGLACSLLAMFYPKDKLKGMRLHELDLDIVEAITDFSMVAKLTKDPPVRKTKEGEEIVKPPSPVSRSTIKQAMRMKCNTLISLQNKKKQVASQAVATLTEKAYM